MRRASTGTIVKLELSQSAYDEIERKLLEGGYAHLFERGPGSAIDMSEIVVVPEPLLSIEEIVHRASKMLAGA